MHRKNAFASLLSLTIGAAVLAAPLPARAAPGLVPATIVQASTTVLGTTVADASVLGIKGDDAATTEGLTVALRKAFALRGMGGGGEQGLEEVMLTMGCETKDDAKCMTEAGKALNVDLLIYGELTSAGSGYTLDIVVLDTTKGMVEAQASTPLAADDLKAANVDLTAAEIVNSLYPGDDDEGVTPPPPVLEPEDDVVVEDQPPPPKEGDLVWGKYNPRPRWKKIGLGVGLGAAGVGIVGAIVTNVLINGYESDVRREAQASLSDAKPENDIDGTIDLCKDARTDVGGGVKNSKVATACRNGDNVRTVNIVSFAVMGVGLATTIAFTVLYFVHKKDSAATTARKRRFQLTGGGSHQGFVLGGTGRF